MQKQELQGRKDTLLIRVAGLCVSLPLTDKQMVSFCQGYLVSPDETPDIVLQVTEQQLQAEHECSGVKDRHALFLACLYRNLCAVLPKYDAFMLHAAVVMVDGVAYAFSAKSGTGKSTHMRLWRRALGPRVIPINGDKPILRFQNGTLYAYGTPWAGKEHFQSNVHAPLKGLCFLDRGTNNCIRSLEKTEALRRTMHQIYRMPDAQMMKKQLVLIDRMLDCCALWHMQCDISEQAALLAYETMRETRDVAESV